MNRRQFIVRSAVALAAPAFSASSYARIIGANDRITVGIMGLGVRGNDMAPIWAKQPNTEVVYFAEPDKTRLDEAGSRYEKATRKPVPKLVADFRAILDDGAVDAFYCCAPNHWHAPAAILGAQAKKHVYVEKPCSHNGQEGEWIVAAANSNGRLMQMGNQRRSFPIFIEAHYCPAISRIVSTG